MRSETCSRFGLTRNAGLDAGTAAKLVVAIYRYGMLAIILALLANRIHLHNTRPPGYTGDPYGGFMGVLALLFNHLAFMFKWPRKITIALWTLAWTWLASTLYYVCYLEPTLFPFP